MKRSLVVMMVAIGVVFAGCTKSNQSTEKKGEHMMTTNAHMSSHSQNEMDNHMSSGGAVSNTNTTVICPVSGSKIAEGEGLEFVHKGMKYTLCCADCIEAIKKNPDKYKKYGTPVK